MSKNMERGKVIEENRLEDIVAFFQSDSDEDYHLDRHVIDVDCKDVAINEELISQSVFYQCAFLWIGESKLYRVIIQGYFFKAIAYS